MISISDHLVTYFRLKVNPQILFCEVQLECLCYRPKSLPEAAKKVLQSSEESVVLHMDVYIPSLIDVDNLCRMAEEQPENGPYPIRRDEGINMKE